MSKFGLVVWSLLLMVDLFTLAIQFQVGKINWLTAATIGFGISDGIFIVINLDERSSR